MPRRLCPAQDDDFTDDPDFEPDADFAPSPPLDPDSDPKQVERFRRVRLLALAMRQLGAVQWEWLHSRPEDDGLRTCERCGRIIDLARDWDFLDAKITLTETLCAECAVSITPEGD